MELNRNGNKFNIVENRMGKKILLLTFTGGEAINRKVIETCMRHISLAAGMRKKEL